MLLDGSNTCEHRGSSWDFLLLLPHVYALSESLLWAIGLESHRPARLKPKSSLLYGHTVSLTFDPGDPVRAARRIERGLLDDRGFAEISKDAEGRIVEEHQRMDGTWEYDVEFDQLGGRTIVRRVREDELTQDVWRSSRGPGESPGYSQPPRVSSTSYAPENLLGVLIAIVAMAGFGAWFLGAALWYPGHQFDYPGGTTGKLALPTWLGGFSAIGGVSMALVALGRITAGDFVRALGPAAAAAVAAAGFWIVAPAIAHHNLSQPYTTGDEAQQSAEQLFEQSLDYRTPDWREPSFLATAAYDLGAHCTPSSQSRSPTNAKAFHVWSCSTTASYHGSLLCRASVLVTGYEVYRRRAVLGTREHRCHNPGVVFIPPSLASEWAQQSQPRAANWQCRISAGLPHDPMGNGYLCHSGDQSLAISPLTANTWQWRAAS